MEGESDVVQLWKFVHGVKESKLPTFCPEISAVISVSV